MDVDHPAIAMALYRETDTGLYTTFEQIGEEVDGFNTFFQVIHNDNL